MPTVSAALFEARHAGRQIDFVMHHQDLLRKNALKCRHRLHCRAAAVHEGLRLQQPQFLIGHAHLRQLALIARLAPPGSAGIVGQPIDEPEACVVARALVFRTRIAQPDDGAQGSAFFAALGFFGLCFRRLRFGFGLALFAFLLAALPARAPRNPLRARIAYHSPCHLGHAQRIVEAPRALLRGIPGVELVEVPDGEQCCGSAGVYNLVEPASADEIGRRKAEAVLSTGATLLASANPGCSLQIRRMLDEVTRFKRLEERLIPDGLDYRAVPGLSTEIRERLIELRPRSLGQASRIPGVTPAAISILTVWCHRVQPAQAAR